jgi:hypothetical protein
MTDIPNIFVTYLLFDEVLFYVMTNKQNNLRTDYLNALSNNPQKQPGTCTSKILF